MKHPVYNADSLHEGVNKAVETLLKNTALKSRLRAFIIDNGYKEEYEFFQELGLTRHYWFQISWGLQDCPTYLKIKIAKALNKDSVQIWEADE